MTLVRFLEGLLSKGYAILISPFRKKPAIVLTLDGVIEL